MAQLTLNLEESNIFYRCVEDCTESVMITDPTGKLLYVNPAWERDYGYSKAEAVGETPRLIHSGHHPKAFYENMWKEILNPEKGNWRGELVNRRKDGELMPVLLSITPFKNGSGNILGFMGVALNMVEQKALERRLAKQDRLASIGVLASGLAHEVGTPLGVIRGRAEMLKMQLGEEVGSSKTLGVIIDQIDRISKLINSLLRFSRTPDDVHLRSIKLLPILDEVLLLLEEKLRKNAIQVEKDIPAEAEVLADPGRLQQVILNLLVNAFQAMQKNGERERKIFLRWQTNPENRMASLSIRDTGSGIAEAHFKKLFEPFFTTKAVGEGTGLGLAIVSKLINEMEGDVTVESTEGQGACFTVKLRTA